MRITRAQVAARTMTGRCPNCGVFGIFKNWFRLHKRCTGCQMELEKEESGFYFGTTSIGYVLAIVFVLLPVCVLVVKGIVGLWLGVSIGVIGSIALCLSLYPVLLCWVIMLYYLVQIEELPQNQNDK